MFLARDSKGFFAPSRPVSDLEGERGEGLSAVRLAFSPTDVPFRKNPISATEQCNFTSFSRLSQAAGR
jgi:hypothetical protein